MKESTPKSTITWSGMGTTNIKGKENAFHQLKLLFVLSFLIVEQYTKKTELIAAEKNFICKESDSDPLIQCASKVYTKLFAKLKSDTANQNDVPQSLLQEGRAALFKTVL